MKNYIEINISPVSGDMSEILIAELSEAGFEGFEEGEQSLKAFIPEESFPEEAFSAIISSHKIGFTRQVIEAKNWNEEWEQNFEPVIVGNFVAVRAEFHRPIKGVEHELIITPKMSFGTGHHATTFLMLQQMQTLEFTGKSVFDFGTGTGILSILAEKLGAASVTATDNDDWSITNAAENLERNQCTQVELIHASIPTGEPKYDIILANINKNVILRYLQVLTGMLSPKGHLLVSGLLTEDEGDVISAGIKAGLKFQSVNRKDKWIAVTFIP